MHAPHDGPPRLESIDAFRGIAIAMMILVNNQGDWSHVYPILRHAAWHGIGGADFVFPFFLFIMGTSLYFWHEALRARGASRRHMFIAVLRRSLILIAIGLALNFFPACSIERLRIPGVLQRIGLCYAVAAGFVIYASLRVQAAAAALVTLGYGAILLWPHPAVSLEPCCTIPGMVDAYLFRGHTYEHALAPGFDPEGLLSSIAASASVLMGVWAGRMAAWDMNSLKRALMPACGVMLIGAGLALSLIIPLNKNLWTPSFLVLTAGGAMILFAVVRALCDLPATAKAWLPFIAMGRNAIIIYILSTIAGKAMTGFHIAVDGVSVTIKAALFRAVISPFFSPMAASLAYACVFLAPWVLTALILYRKRCFVRI